MKFFRRGLVCLGTRLNHSSKIQNVIVPNEIFNYSNSTYKATRKAFKPNYKDSLIYLIIHALTFLKHFISFDNIFSIFVNYADE